MPPFFFLRLGPDGRVSNVGPAANPPDLHKAQKNPRRRFSEANSKGIELRPHD